MSASPPVEFTLPAIACVARNGGCTAFRMSSIHVPGSRTGVRSPISRGKRRPDPVGDPLGVLLAESANLCQKFPSLLQTHHNWRAFAQRVGVQA